jgi:hypothetical protein
LNFWKRIFEKKEPTPAVNAASAECAATPEIASPSHDGALKAASGPWRARPFFISSTFRDMHAERDYLRNMVFPELEERLRSRPFLLVPLGARYGWVPPEERISVAAQDIGFAPDALDKSVTALEIKFGILKRDPDQRRRSLFYFREPLSCDAMQPDVTAVYSEIDSHFIGTVKESL